MTYEIVYTAAMERQAVEAQQRPAPPLEPRYHVPRFGGNARMVVLRYLEHHASYRSLADIITGTGLHQNTVNGAIYRLRQLGYVVRSHAQNSNRREPVRYRVSA